MSDAVAVATLCARLGNAFREIEASGERIHRALLRAHGEPNPISSSTDEKRASLAAPSLRESVERAENLGKVFCDHAERLEQIA